MTPSPGPGLARPPRVTQTTPLRLPGVPPLPRNPRPEGCSKLLAGQKGSHTHTHTHPLPAPRGPPDGRSLRRTAGRRGRLGSSASRGRDKERARPPARATEPVPNFKGERGGARWSRKPPASSSPGGGCAPLPAGSVPPGRPRPPSPPTLPYLRRVPLGSRRLQLPPRPEEEEEEGGEPEHPQQRQRQPPRRPPHPREGKGKKCPGGGGG